MTNARPFVTRCRKVALLLSLGAALSATGCYDFHLIGPEDPTPVVPPGLVDVTIEYRQPNLCSASSGCDDLVVFSASWMPLQTGIFLERATPSFWRGLARGVPVNFPPRDDPHVVTIYDPHLRDTETRGFTAARLQVGRQVLNSFLKPGTPEERAFVYIDENGFGHNP